MGCSNNDDDVDDSEITLEFWTINLKKDFGDYIEGLIDEYEAENNDVKIDWVDVPGDDIQKKFIAELSSEDVPDVVNLSSFLLNDLPDGVLYPISDLADDSTLNQYFSKMLDSLTYDDELLGIPWYNNGPKIGLLNEKDYKEANLDPENPPQSWEEFFANSEKINNELSEVYGSNDFPTLEMLQAHGVDLLSDDGKEAVFNTDKAIDFVQMFVDGYDSGAIAPGTLAVVGEVSGDVGSKQQTLANGLIGHKASESSTRIAEYEENAPTRFKDLKVFPAISDTGNYAINHTMSFVIPQKTKHPEEAADFALFVTNPENQLEFSKEANVFPSTKKSMEDEFFEVEDSGDIYDEARKIQVENMENLVITNIDIGLRELYQKEIEAAFLDNKTVEEALNDAVKKWDEKLNE